MNPELRAIVRTMRDDYGNDEAEAIIMEAHRGRLRRPITTDNMHLFRLYRNKVSANPAVMIADALNQCLAGWYTPTDKENTDQ